MRYERPYACQDRCGDMGKVDSGGRMRGSSSPYRSQKEASNGWVGNPRLLVPAGKVPGSVDITYHLRR